jgi:hypothetical protein
MIICMYMPHSGRFFMHRTDLILLLAGNIPVIQILKSTAIITFHLCPSVYNLMRFNSFAIS